MEIWKTCLTFAPLSRSSERGCDKDEVPNKIGIKFFEDFEQLRKFYPLLQESDFKQYLWDLSWDLKKSFYTMESLILAQDER